MIVIFGTGGFANARHYISICPDWLPPGEGEKPKNEAVITTEDEDQVGFGDITAWKAVPANTKIFIVRHADRLGNADDLSALGMTRANELKRVLGLAKIDSIFSTNFTRTKKTAQPLATQLGLPIRLYTDIPATIKHIVEDCAGKTVLVVGHSNTLDDLIKSCGCKPPAAIDPEMPITQYDNLFLVIVQRLKGQRLLRCEFKHMKYGAVTN